jgi:signal peptidase I
MDRATRLSLAMDMLNEVIERDEDVPLKTFGMSMVPFIYGGDWVVVRRVNAEKVRLGDVVIYQAGNVVVAHRVIRRREQNSQVYFTVKGDAHLAAEGETTAGEIVAKVVALQKAGQRIDLDRPRWRLANRLIALCSAWVDSLCASRVGRCGDTKARDGRSLRHRFTGVVSGLNHLFIRLLVGRRAAPVEQELDGAAI